MRDEWFPLIRSRAAKRAPVAVRLLDEPLIVVRAAANDLRIFPAQRWSRLLAHSAPGQASTYCAEERDGLIWCSLGRPSAPAPAWPHVDWPGIMGGSEIECNFVRLVENMMDASHAAFIHGGLLRARPSKLVRYMVRETATGVIKINHGEKASGSLLYKLFGRGESEFSHVEEFVLPNWVRAEYRTTQGDVVFAVQFAFAPTASTRTRVFYRVCSSRAISRVQALNRVAMFVLGRLVNRVVQQDRWILEAEERALRAVHEAPRRVSTSADIAATWAGRRATDFAAGRSHGTASLERSVEFELRL
jgi:phenylpropionate dioxygenase-like ring-hydroxylating dioxygenase large terminal subunit